MEVILSLANWPIAMGNISAHAVVSSLVTNHIFCKHKVCTAVTRLLASFPGPRSAAFLRVTGLVIN